MGSYRGTPIELPAGRAGMLQRSNRLHAEADELFDAKGVSFEDGTLRKEAGADVYGTLAPTSLEFAGTWAASRDWNGFLIGFTGPDPKYSRTIGENNGTNGNSTILVNFPAIEAGTLVLMYLVGLAESENATFSDSRGNTYFQLSIDHGTQDQRLRVGYTRITNKMPSGSTLRVTTAAASDYSWGAIAITGVDAGSFGSLTDTDTGTDVSMTPTGTPPDVLLQVAVVMGDNQTTGFTPSTGYVERSMAAHSGYQGRVFTRRNDPTPIPIAMHDWHPTPTVHRLVVATLGGSVLRESNEGVIDGTLTSSLSAARPGRFVVGGKEAAAQNRKLFYFNGADPVQVLSGDGSSMATISTPPADWSGTNQPINGGIHRLRLFGFGNANDPHRVYFSDPDNHEDFQASDAFQLPIRSSVGDRLYGWAPYQGLLWLWKFPRGIFYLDDSPVASTEWAIRTKSEGVGCAPSSFAVLPIDDDVLFLSADASFHLLSAVDALGGVRASDLSYHLGLAKWLRDNVELSRLDQTVSVWYPHKKVALFGVPARGDGNNTLTLKFDFGLYDGRSPKSVRFSYTRRDEPNAYCLRRDADQIERPLMAEAGDIYRIDEDARHKAGGKYEGRYRLPNLDLGEFDEKLRTRTKHWDALEIFFNPVAKGALWVQPIVDDVPKGPPLAFDATKPSVRKPLNVGAGRTFAIEAWNDALNEDFDVCGHAVSIRPGDEDQR